MEALFAFSCDISLFADSTIPTSYVGRCRLALHNSLIHSTPSGYLMGSPRKLPRYFDASAIRGDISYPALQFSIALASRYRRRLAKSRSWLSSKPRVTWTQSIAATGYFVRKWVVMLPLDARLEYNKGLNCMQVERGSSSAGSGPETSQASRTSRVSGCPRNAKLPARRRSSGLPSAWRKTRTGVEIRWDAAQ